MGNKETEVERRIRLGRCLFCGEKFDETRTIRGCHERCAQGQRRAIAAGELTEAEAIKRGTLLPGRKRKYVGG